MTYEQFIGEARSDTPPHCTACNDHGCDQCCCSVHGRPVEDCAGLDCELIEGERADRVTLLERVAEAFDDDESCDDREDESQA